MTSSIIGCFRYLSSPRYLISALERSKSINGRFLKLNTVPNSVQYYYWPAFHRAELDVIIVFEDGEGTKEIVLIEAKYLSGKSSEEDLKVEPHLREKWQQDQISRELVDLYDPSNFEKIHVAVNDLTTYHFIYLTTDSIMPVESIRNGLDNAKDLLTKIKEEVYWLDWSSFYEAALANGENDQDHIILEDLRMLCIRKNLTRFTGWSNLVLVKKHQLNK